MSGICNCRRVCVLLVIIFFCGFIYKVFESENTSNKLIGEDGRPVLNSRLNLTEIEQEALENLRNRAKIQIASEPYLRHDAFLIKYLQVSDFNVEESYKLLIENLEWRLEKNVSRISEEDWSDVAKDFEYDINRVDIMGRPVLFIDLGSWNIKQATRAGKGERVKRLITKIFNEASNLVYQKYEAGQDVTDYWLLIQLDDFSIFQGACVQCMSIYLALADVWEYKYPRMGSQMVTINTPGLFSIVYNIMKPVFSETTRNNIHLLGDPEEWEPILMKLGIHLNQKIRSEESAEE